MAEEATWIKLDLLTGSVPLGSRPNRRSIIKLLQSLATTLIFVSPSEHLKNYFMHLQIVFDFHATQSKIPEFDINNNMINCTSY
jgi:hypothetical protein